MIRIDIEYNYDMVHEIDGRMFNIKRVPIEIEWKCPNCGTCNCNDDEYLEDNYTYCSECDKEYAVDLDSGNQVEVVIPREEYEGRY